MSKRHLELTFILSAGRSIGLILSFSIPIFLSRYISVELYGTYKQIILIYWFCMAILNMGMDSTLFYFSKNTPEHTPTFAANIFLFNNLISSTLAILLLFFGRQLAVSFNSPLLNEYMPQLALMIILGVSSQYLDDVFLIYDKIKFRIIADIILEFGKCMSIMIAVYFFHSLHYALWALISLLFIRYVYILFFILKSHGFSNFLSLFNFKMLREQIQYAFPYGLSRLLSFITDMEKLFISYLFGIRTFTFYSVGCFENPIIPTIRNNIYDLMNLDMVDAKKKNNYFLIQSLWKSLTRKLFFIQVPIGIYMIVFAPELISLIFSDKYSQSIPYFQLFNVLLILTAFSPEVLFLVFKKTKLYLKLQVINFLTSVFLIIFMAMLFGPLAALWGKLVSLAINSIIKLAFAKRFLKLGWSDLFVWNQLISIILISLTSALLAKVLISPLPFNSLTSVFVSCGLFTPMVFIFSCMTNIIAKDEREYIKELLTRKILLRT